MVKRAHRKHTSFHLHNTSFNTCHDAGNHEPGWHRRSSEYLQVTYSMERTEEFDQQVRRHTAERAHAPINGFITRDHERCGEDNMRQDQ